MSLSTKKITSHNKLILDAGCGSGWITLALAQANPDAKIVCIDLSLNSLKVAEERLKFHGFDNIKYHQLAIKSVTELDYQFDYINCDNVLYFANNPVNTLKHLLNQCLHGMRVIGDRLQFIFILN